MTRLVIVMVVCLQTVAGAQEPDALMQARAHFDAGRTLYDAGAYGDALREFNMGYELSHKPRFLLNIAQTYRKLNELGRAREALGKFLDETPAGDPYRSTAEALLKEIDASDKRPPATPPPAPAPPPAVTTTTPPPPPTVTPLPTVTAPPTVTPPPAVTAPPAALSSPPPKPVAHRGWVWGAVAGGIVVAGGAIALGVVLGSSSQYPSGLKVPVQ